MKGPKDSIVQWDIDEAAYIGDGQDGVYYQVAEGPDGWYVTAVVDSDTGSFVDTIVSDDGPYPTKEEAEMGGKNAAYGWCIDNQVSWEDGEEEEPCKP